MKGILPKIGLRLPMFIRATLAVISAPFMAKITEPIMILSSASDLRSVHFNLCNIDPITKETLYYMD